MCYSLQQQQQHPTNHTATTDTSTVYEKKHCGIGAREEKLRQKVQRGHCGTGKISYDKGSIHSTRGEEPTPRIRTHRNNKQHYTQNKQHE